MESSDGTQRIAPREIFEDVYVAMGPAVEKWPLLDRRNFSLSDLKRRTSARAEMLARAAGIFGPRPGRPRKNSNNGKSGVARLQRAT